MVYSVKAKWEACMVSRKSKVSIFTKCLYGKRDHTRACLEQRLKERARCHLIHFENSLLRLRHGKGPKGPRQIRLLPPLLGPKNHCQLLLYPQNQHPLQGPMHETLPQLETLCS